MWKMSIQYSAVGFEPTTKLKLNCLRTDSEPFNSIRFHQNLDWNKISIKRRKWGSSISLPGIDPEEKEGGGNREPPWEMSPLSDC